MKALKAITLLALPAILAACSNEAVDEPTNPNDSPTHFINVSIRMSNPPTRTAEEPVFDDGTTEENQIRKIIFAFYNESGICVANASIDNPSFEVSYPVNDNIQSIYSATKVPVNLPVGASLPVSMMVFLNPTNESDVATNTLSEIKVLQRATHKTVEDENVYFVMNNSVYFNGSGVKQVEVATPANAYYVTEEQAASAPYVDVYVERMAVKVSFDYDANFNVNSDEYNKQFAFDATSPSRAIKFVPEHWGITCTEKNMYLIKHFGDAYDNTSWVQASLLDGTGVFEGWNSFTYRRCYWANSVTYGKPSDFYPDVTDDLVSTTGTLPYFLPAAPTYKTTFPINYLKYTEINRDVATSGYCNENTLSTFTPSAATSVIVAGKYKFVDNGEDVGTFYVRNENGDYKFYRENDIKLFFVNRLSEFLTYEGNPLVLTESNYATILADFQLVHPTQALNSSTGSSKVTERLVTLTLKNSSNLSKYKYKNAELAEVAITAANLESVNKQIHKIVSVAETFKDGKAIFFWALRHVNPDADGLGHYGAVRNHWYKVTLNKITGLGTGILSPDAPLIPHSDETEFGINASVKILAWRVIDNTAILDK